ncbi:methyltransferase domain-containing protein [Caldichromatium japonicum]|uniref:Methyltransferase domain-containing protein n=1 Tax=Caldichromatium japonicum TaxID=2699430 RepID=A0A6G7V9P2_9GAMM|nr:RsmB/NOP family class I SAM-dependent RNA methyltransferase [Caldichromatium japonicum]QIK36779.1 methyltransferase domain-containing protein [Caldichromatium japonicum]
MSVSAIDPTLPPAFSRRTQLTAARIAGSWLNRYRELIDDWPAFVDSLCCPLPVVIWANPTRISVAELAELLCVEGLEPEPIPGLPNALRLPADLKVGQQWWYCAGLAHAQEVVSQLPAALLDLRPGLRVLDLCAAPGGKTAQLAFALGNRGTVIANDIAYERLKALQGNLDRLGVLNVTTSQCDGVNWPSRSGQFDRILVDAPCASEGTLRRYPRLVERLDPAGLGRLAARQRALLRKAVQRCRPGGLVLYSTCTFAPEENELVVAEVLDEFGGRVWLRPIALPGLIASPGVTEWQGRRLDPQLARCLRLWPHHNDTGGFFMALLEKDPSLSAEPEPELAAIGGEGHEDWLLGLSAKYGLPADYWQGYRVHRQTRRGLHLIAADHAPPAWPKAAGHGIFFHRTQVSPPKPTTGGALVLGCSATQFCLELTAEQRDAYLRRETFAPTASQRLAHPPGQTIVTYRGHPLGVAVLHRSGVIESLFPWHWSGRVASLD